MDPAFDAAFRSWSLDGWRLAPIAIAGVVYIRGWRRMQAQRPDPERALAPLWFGLGLATLAVALVSPIDAFANLLLSAHMLQHVLLTMVAPPLLVRADPLLPMLRGLPLWVQREVVGPWFRWPPSRGLGARLCKPIVAWTSFVAVTWIWHLPALYELAVRSPGWHEFEHACFLGTALLFWSVALGPTPMRDSGPRWWLIPYFLLADVQNTAFGAIFCFAPRVIYPSYGQAPAVAGWSPIDDQGLAGALMWIVGSLAFLTPLPGIVMDSLRSRPTPRRPAPTVPSRKQAHRMAPSRRWDLLDAPIVGWFLRWPGARRRTQAILFALAVAVVIDGWTGPQVAAMNLAGVLPWTFWRGLAALALLFAGNWFCFGCPLTLPRAMARRFLPRGRRWPRVLRSKWLPASVIVVYLWAYETFALWDRPSWTAWIVVGYFAAAFLVDSLFRDGSFCKYVCPIGQFHFVQSISSPVEVAVREPAKCPSCGSKDCIRGSDQARGCELQLFQPQKIGNLDCTFCLDCVHACPIDNVGLLPVIPASSIPPTTSPGGRWEGRADVAALTVVLAFGAFANALGMVEPVVATQDRLLANLGLDGAGWLVAAFISATVVVGPAMAIGLAAAVGRCWSRSRASLRRTAIDLAYCLAPMGAAMWTAHFCFHFFTSYPTIVPLAERVARDWGLTSGGPVSWECDCCSLPPDGLVRFEILALGWGWLLALRAAWTASLRQLSDRSAALRAFAPAALLLMTLYALGVWIVFQPMQMRGTMLLGEG